MKMKLNSNINCQSLDRIVNLQMVVKLKESFEKTRQVKINEKSKKHILKRHRNTRYYEKILSNKKESNNFVNFL